MSGHYPVRSYRPRRRRTRDGRIRWALEGSCVTCDDRCTEHWTLLPQRFPSESTALEQAAQWQRRQAVWIEAERSTRRPAA